MWIRFLCNSKSICYITLNKILMCKTPMLMLIFCKQTARKKTKSVQNIYKTTAMCHFIYENFSNFSKKV